jgi:hypothetical protein
MNKFEIDHDEATQMLQLLKNYPNKEWHISHISGTLTYILELSKNLATYFGY